MQFRVVRPEGIERKLHKKVVVKPENSSALCVYIYIYMYVYCMIFWKQLDALKL